RAVSGMLQVAVRTKERVAAALRAGPPRAPSGRRVSRTRHGVSVKKDAATTPGGGDIVTRPILPLLLSGNQSVPAGPDTAPRAPAWEGGAATPATPPAAVSRRTRLTLLPVNQRARSGPAAISSGPLLGVGIENSVRTPAVVSRPILLTLYSVNQRAPS